MRHIINTCGALLTLPGLQIGYPSSEPEYFKGTHSAPTREIIVGVALLFVNHCQPELGDG